MLVILFPRTKALKKYKLSGEERKHTTFLSPAVHGNCFVKGFAGIRDRCEIMPDLVTAVAPGCTI